MAGKVKKKLITNQAILDAMVSYWLVRDVKSGRIANRYKERGEKSNRDAILQQVSVNHLDQFSEIKKRFEEWCKRYDYNQKAAKRSLVWVLSQKINCMMNGTQNPADEKRSHKMLDVMMENPVVFL